MNYTEKTTLYEQSKKSLRKVKGDQAFQKIEKNSSAAIKLDAVYQAENEEALVAAGYIRQSKFNNANVYRGGRGQGRGLASTGRGAGQRGQYTNFNHHQGALRRNNFGGSSSERPVNPPGANGQILTCIACGSFRHMLADCPHSWENLSKVNFVSSEQVARPVLFTGNIKADINQLGNEARNCAVLDCACSSTVCGQQWLVNYLDSSNDSDKENVRKSAGIKVFKFGGGEKLTSLGCYYIPAVIADTAVTIQTDVVTSDIPLLLSLDVMKRAKIKLDLEHDSAEIYGKVIALNHTSLVTTVFHSTNMKCQLKMYMQLNYIR